MTGLGVPAYFHPRRDAADWARLHTAGSFVDLVVINPCSGPGPINEDDVLYREAAGRLTCLVAGYVPTAYATRSLDDVLADVEAYRHRHGVAGVFADEVPSSACHLPYYARLRSEVPGALVLNPGVAPHPAYLALADVVVTFEGPWTAHRVLEGPPTRGSARTWHLVHGVPAGEQARTIERAGALGADHVLATGLTLPNPWAALPTPWPGEPT